jgi:ParB/RepB/Spo0J family partition protein
VTEPVLVQEAHRLSSHINILDIFVGKRRRRDYGNIEELSKDFTENGQITAITVRPPSEEELSDPDYKGEHWVLVAGGRRMAAAMRLGWQQIRAIDREAMDPLKHRVLELAENLQRKDMDFVEVVQAKQEMYLLRTQQNPELTQAEFAREIGETPKTTSQDLRVAELIEQRPELKQASSRKAVLRAGKMIDHLEARVARDVVQGTSKMTDLGQRMVTADAQDWLRSRADQEFDLIFSDPPYGIDHYKQGHKTTDGNSGLSEYDDSEGVSLDLFVDMVPQMIRVTKRTGWIILFQAEANYEFLKKLFEDCCLTHCQYRIYQPDPHGQQEIGLDFCSGHDENNDCQFRKVEEPRWIWYRPNSQNNPRFPEEHAKNVYEHLLVFNMGGGKLLRPCNNVLVYDAEYGSRIHAMQKPVEMCVDVISRVTLGGEKIADPFYGSGALLKAGARLARSIFGCEKNPALRAPAMGYVSEDYDGAAPLRENTLNTTEEFLDTQLEDFSDEDAAEMEDLAL